MYQKLFYILLASTLSASCNTQEKNTDKSGSETKDTENKSSPINCYNYTGNGDTISLKLIHVGKSITGTLVYKLKEKDSNKGTIQGSMRRNILVADYTFMSEGIQSIRQIAFKLDKDIFTEGYGEIYTENDKVYFKNLDSLKFNDSMKLTEASCD